MIRKSLIGVGVFLVVVIIAMVAAPFIFKSEIKQAIDDQLEANIDADVLYDIDKFSVSFFSNFPNLTAGINDFAIIGREPFAGKTLLAVDGFEIELNIWKLLSSELSVEGIYLSRPQIFIKVLKDGSANYDIAISSKVSSPEEKEEATEDFNFAIEHWEIREGHIVYDDATIPTYLEFTGFNHTGSGNFSLSLFDLETTTQSYIEKLSYDGVSYLVNRKVNLDMILAMDLDQMKFTFKENELAINDFSFGFNGWVAMPDEDINMDLTFNSKKNSFKSLISLIPTIYSEDFDELETSGNISFDGLIKGTYNAMTIPAYNVNLKVSEGMFHYPDLPEAVNNVQIALNIASDGDIDNTAIDLSKFHLEFGTTPVNGFLKIDNLIDYPIDFELNTAVNLANLNHLLPMDGLEIAGMLEAHVKAVGKYDSITSQIPKIDAMISYKEGAIRYDHVPAPIDNINIVTSLNNNTGLLNDTKISVSELSFKLDENPIRGELYVDDLENINWRASLNGDLNFDKLFPIINKLYPMPGTTIGGDIVVKINSDGNMNDVEKENYSALNTSGEAVFTQFNYTDSVYLPQGFQIMSGVLSFDPKQIAVDELQTQVGSSDFRFNGRLSNYISYLFNDEVINGKLLMTSNKLSVDEFMTDSEGDSIIAAEESYSVIEVPANIDFEFIADIKEINYDDLLLQDAKGEIIVKDEAVILNKLYTRTLGGTITFDGGYYTEDINKPRFDMSMDVANIEISQAYQAFNTVRVMAPIARDLSGRTSTLFALNGILQEDMMPDQASLNGQGKVIVKDASLRDSKFASGLIDFLKGSENQSLTLKDMSMDVRISNGRLAVEPFDLKINDLNANIGGLSGVDGSVDYTVKMDVPAGQLGAQVNSLLSSLTGQENDSENIQLNIGIGGTYDDPKFNLLGSDAKSTVTKAATQKATELVKQNTGVDVPITKEEVNKEAVEQARKQADAILLEAQKQGDLLKSEASKTATQIREEAKVQNDKLIKEAGSNFLKKKAAEVAGKKLLEEADNQANKIEAEAASKADLLMENAKKQADTLISQAENN